MGTGSKKRSSKKKKDNSYQKKGDIKAIVYVAIGVLLCFSTYTDLAGILSIFTRKLMYHFIGIIVYIIPIYLIYFGIDTIKSKGTIKYSRRFFSVTLIAILIWLFFSTISINFTIGDNINKGFITSIRVMKFSENYNIHGGFLGFLISYPLARLMGYIGCYILYITLFAIGSILLMDITLYDVYIKIKLLIKGIIGDEKINNQNKKNNKKI